MDLTGDPNAFHLSYITEPLDSMNTCLQTYIQKGPPHNELMWKQWETNYPGPGKFTQGACFDMGYALKMNENMCAMNGIC